MRKLIETLAAVAIAAAVAHTLAPEMTHALGGLQAASAALEPRP